jgi:predicted TIM-barrel fold metal-dependent hydrolase
MKSRRDVLIGTGLAGIAALARPIASAFAVAAQPRTPVNFAVPDGACDSHTCIVADPAKFPLAASRGYTPEPASLDEMRSMHRALHIQRVVIVQPSFYGTDNSLTLDIIKQLGPNTRGVALIDENTSNEELDRLHRGGICGIIFDAGGARSQQPEDVRQRFKTAVERCRGRGWHIEFHGKLPDIEALQNELLASPVPVIFDHFGGAQPELGLDQPGFAALLKLVRSGNVYVDVSAPYRVSKQAPDYPDVVPIAKAIIAANPQRVTWGTGWPHPTNIPGRAKTDPTPLLQIDDAHNLNLLASWTSGAEQLRLALVENPARLYGF